VIQLPRLVLLLMASCLATTTAAVRSPSPVPQESREDCLFRYGLDVGRPSPIRNRTADRFCARG
jgi:hypothetical protein